MRVTDSVARFDRDNPGTYGGLDITHDESTSVCFKETLQCSLREMTYCDTYEGHKYTLERCDD